MMLLPDRLRELWGGVTEGRMSPEAFASEQEQLLEIYRADWQKALLSDGETDLRTSLLREVAAYYGNSDLAEVEHRCACAVDTLRHEWQGGVDPWQRASIESFYESPSMVYELMDWHSLRDDTGPLAYVLALEVAREHHAQTCLDFGSGVGSGALLFSRAGIEMTLADISTVLLDFARWRFTQRGLPARFLDLKQLPCRRLALI
jgi:methylase of polypeptide subunit release factors